MGENERCKVMILMTYFWVLSSKPNHLGTYLFVVDPTRDEERESNNPKSKVKILDSH